MTTTKGSEVDKASKTLHIDASKLLSSNEEDLEFISYAQIVKGNIDKLTYKDPSPISNAATLEEQVQALSMTQDSATITILPPTGKQEDINYTLLILELAILSNIEFQNAKLIEHGINQKERLSNKENSFKIR